MAGPDLVMTPRPGPQLHSPPAQVSRVSMSQLSAWGHVRHGETRGTREARIISFITGDKLSVQARGLT